MDNVYWKPIISEFNLYEIETEIYIDINEKEGKHIKIISTDSKKDHITSDKSNIEITDKEESFYDNIFWKPNICEINSNNIVLDL